MIYSDIVSTVIIVQYNYLQCIMMNRLVAAERCKTTLIYNHVDIRRVQSSISWTWGIPWTICLCDMISYAVWIKFYHADKRYYWSVNKAEYFQGKSRTHAVTLATVITSNAFETLNVTLLTRELHTSEQSQAADSYPRGGGNPRERTTANIVLIPNCFRAFQRGTWPLMISVRRCAAIRPYIRASRFSA